MTTITNEHLRNCFTSVARRSALGAAIALAGLAMAVPTAGAQTIISTGHWDFEIPYANGAWDPHWHDHDTGTEIDFGDGVMTGYFLSNDSANQFDYPFPRPTSSQWNFTGASAGQLMFVFPSSNPQPFLPYIGLASEETSFGVFVNDRITLSFRGIASGPAGGDFSLYTFAAGNPRAFFSSAGDSFTFNGNNTLAVNVGSHSHYNWAFDTPGLYELLFEASGNLVGGGTTSSGEFSVFFRVIPEPSSLATAGLLGLAALRRRR